jgi:eukaryotic-like serine/threonine-protein kinase
MSSAEPRRPSEDSSGELGEKYRSLYVIGRGGMGRVEVALELKTNAGDPTGFERIVALKRLLPEGARDKRHTEMFLREARLAVLLTHPNVVHAFDFGEVGGEFFLAMEYIEGEPLSRVLSVSREKGKQVGATIAAHILANICEGLHAAHELRDVSGTMLNVVHRDVSPHNVMVAY